MAIFRRFAADRSGNFAVLTALAIVPVFCGGMALMEYDRISTERQMLGGALDNTMLAVSREFIRGKSFAELQRYGEGFLKANLRVSQPDRATFTLNCPDADGGGYRLSASLSYRYVLFDGRFGDGAVVPMTFGTPKPAEPNCSTQNARRKAQQHWRPRQQVLRP